MYEPVAILSDPHLDFSKQHELDHSHDPTTAVNKRKLKIASLAIPIVSAATASPPDPIALCIISRCAQELASDIFQIVQLARSKHPHLCNPELGATLSVTGGVISQPVYLDAVIQKLESRGVKFSHVEVVTDAAGEGALALAVKSQRDST